MLTSLIILLFVIASLLILDERKTFDVSTLVQVDPIPHTKELIEQKKYVEAQEYLNYFIEYDYVKENPQANELLISIKKQRSLDSYKTSKILEGIVQGKSDESIGQTSAFLSDFLIIGDIRDLTIEGIHYLNGTEVDNLMVSLSSLGLLATASQVYTRGKTTPIKDSILLLKYGKRSNKIPLWLQTKLIKQIKLAKNTKSLKKIQELLAPLEQLHKESIKP